MGSDFPRGRSWATPAKSWTDPEKWARVVTPEGCPLCPFEPWDDFHVELTGSWVLIPEEASLPGYVLVVSKQHVVEPYELPPDAAVVFWSDCMRTASAVASLVRPVKMNYEVHGNTVPHLHMHIFPRFIGDPFERGPIDPQSVPPVHRTAAERETLRRVIASGAKSALPKRAPPTRR